MATMKFCPYCGEKHKDRGKFANFCIACGRSSITPAGERELQQTISDLKLDNLHLKNLLNRSRGLEL